MGFDYSGISDVPVPILLTILGASVAALGLTVYENIKITRREKIEEEDMELEKRVAEAHGDERMIDVYRGDIKIAMNEISAYSKSPDRTLKESEDLFKRICKVMTENMESLIEREENKTK